MSGRGNSITGNQRTQLLDILEIHKIEAITSIIQIRIQIVKI